MDALRISQPCVVSVSASGDHTFSKTERREIRLVSGEGVEGDAHRGRTVQHRSRVAVDPRQPNLRQVHLVGEELLDELRQRGFDVARGSIGENIVTRGIDLPSLPRDTELALGSDAVVRITGLRNPCAQLDAFQSGLLAVLSERDAQGQFVRKIGVMAIVVTDGIVLPGDSIRVKVPPGTPVRLDRV